MSLTVTVRDNETGEEQTANVADGDYVLITAPPCRLDGIQAYPPRGTVVLTIRGWTNKGKTPTPHPEDAPEPETMEREAGRLLVEAARLRAARAGRGDAHELRHLWAAINAGNSDPCGENGESCHLDVEAIRRWTEQYPKVAGLAPQPTDTPEAGS